MQDGGADVPVWVVSSELVIPLYTNTTGDSVFWISPSKDISQIESMPTIKVPFYFSHLLRGRILRRLDM